jgi:1-aminocyclopropane-1-carboxylate deaminase/D-cysteine desulfhydrase-like pyridoxal-dependent ACC family enzyme
MYRHVPKPVYEDGDVTVLWNQAVHTDREVIANRSDIIIKKKGEHMHTDRRGNAGRQKCLQKEAEKKLKYKSFCIEIKRMRNLKCIIIPVIIGATGIVTRSLRKNLEAIPGKYSIDSLQKTAILETSSHIIRKVLQCEA